MLFQSLHKLTHASENDNKNCNSKKKKKRGKKYRWSFHKLTKAVNYDKIKSLE